MVPVFEIQNVFQKSGYLLIENFFSKEEIFRVKEIILSSNQNWQRLYFNERNVNSNYLTSSRFCTNPESRNFLFQFISDSKLVSLAEFLCNSQVYFLNTQLFYNPDSEEAKPYWHRDLQYLGVSEEIQQEILKKDHVLHFRIPLEQDPGMEFISGSHLRWDTEEERKIRLELDGHKNSEDMRASIQVIHNPCDLLVFSAHLIHRGVYGLNRISFDILYTSFKEKENVVRQYNHFPDEIMLDSLENKRIFEFEKAN